MEISDFKIVRCCGRGKSFNLYCFNYTTTSVGKQDLIRNPQFPRTNPFAHSIRLYAFKVDDVSVASRIQNVERMSARANDFFTVYADVIPLFRFVAEKPCNRFIRLLTRLFVIRKHFIADFDFLDLLQSCSRQDKRPRNKALSGRLTFSCSCRYFASLRQRTIRRFRRIDARADKRKHAASAASAVPAVVCFRQKSYSNFSGGFSTN